MTNQVTKKLKSETKLFIGRELKLSEVKKRFRVRNGEIEIEYEGPLAEVNKRFDKAYDWVTSQKIVTSKEKEETTDQGKVAGQKDKRGGYHKPMYGEKIDELIEEGFFKKRKSLDEVVVGLVPKNVPTRGQNARNAILNNLRRKIASKNAVLKGAKEEDVWYFWVD
jgi:hypothetical protein